MKKKSLFGLLLMGLVITVTSCGPRTDAEKGKFTEEESRAALGEPLQEALSHYSKVQKALASDSLNNVSAEAQALAGAARSNENNVLSAHIAEQAEELAKAQDLKAARQAFKPLSESLIDLLAKRRTEGSGYYSFYCSMADASWLQTKKQVENPYMGSSMLDCGEVKKTF